MLISTLNNPVRNHSPKKTGVGTVFVSNYPPYNTWNAESVPLVLDRLSCNHVDSQVPLGLYVHIPFCQRRCKFCWYKVHTGGDSMRHVREYLNALGKELELYAGMPAFQGRSLQYVHFGGGTPSLIAVKHLRLLLRRLKDAFPWRKVREVTFECNPGTLSREKAAALRDLGVTRISLGMQNFNNAILEASNRVHTAADSVEAFRWIRAEAFPLVSIDLLAGMPGETDENWHDTVDRTLDLGPDAVSIYQMELPRNTVFAQDINRGKEIVVADWEKKHEWAAHAFEVFLAAGYEITDSRSVIKSDKRTAVSPSLYQDGINEGFDLISIGASPFGCIADAQYQNESGLKPYLDAVSHGELPITRAVVMDERTRFVRELILQLKTGNVNRACFREKFGLDPIIEFTETLKRLYLDGMIEDCSNDTIRLTFAGLLQVDFWLPLFYAKS